MYAGHFAAALYLHTAVPRAPSAGLPLGTGLIDILFGIFLLFGIESAVDGPSPSPLCWAA